MEETGTGNGGLDFINDQQLAEDEMLLAGDRKMEKLVRESSKY
jgi:hypothetical protein